MSDTLTPAEAEQLPDDPGDAAAGGGNPFADIDREAAAPAANDDDNPFRSMFPQGIAPGQSGTIGAFAAHAARGALPTAGGLVGAGAGAEAGGGLGALAGAAGGPVGAGLGAAAGGLVGGIAGFFGGSSAVEGAQDWALRQLPDSWAEAIGQSDREQRLQEQQHPIASFLGGLAPYAITMSPGGLAKSAAKLPANATSFQRIMANPITARLFGGAAMGGMELGQEEYSGQTPSWAKVGIATGFGLVFNKPTQFGEYLTGLGTQAAHAVVPREGVLNPTEPTVAQAADLGVVGPGVTESTFQGSEAQSDATRATAHNDAADEQVALGAWPEPDTDGIARRMAPETFARNDELLAQRDSLRQFVDRQSNPGADEFDELADRQAMTEAALRSANPRSPDAQNYRAQLADIEAQRADLTARQQAWESGEHVDTPELAMARQHLLSVEHDLWDLGPEISAARRRAAEAGGLAEPEGAGEPPDETAEIAPQAKEAEPAGPTPEPATPPLDIAADVSRKLVEAGRPQDEGDAAGALWQAYYDTRAGRFGGAKGSGADLYAAEAPDVRGAAERVREPEFAQTEGPPVSKIAGEEIAPRDADLKTLRQAARAYYDTQLRGTKTHSRALNRDVEFRSSRKAFHGSANPDKLRLFASLRDIIEKGTLENTAPPRAPASEPTTRAYHFLTAPVELNGKVVRVGVMIREDANGHLYYNHTPFEDVGSPDLRPAGTRREGGPGTEGGATHRQSVGAGSDDVNLSVGPAMPRGAKRGLRGKIRLPSDGRPLITLFKSANASTFLHETGHAWLEEMLADARDEKAPAELTNDARAVREWLRADPEVEITTRQHEKFARGFEQYLREGVAPSPALAGVFAKFKAWLMKIYATIKGLGAPINEDIRGVFDRMLAQEPRRTIYSPERTVIPSAADVHETDAAETEPHEAEAVGDRVAAETNRRAETPPPEVANDHAAEAAGETGAGTGAEPAGEAGAGSGDAGEVSDHGGEPKPVTPGGDVGVGNGPVERGGGAAVSKSDDLSGSGAGTDRRSGVGATAGAAQPGAGEFAPRPADTFGDTEPKLTDLAGNIRVENLTDVESIAQAIHDSAERNDDFKGVRGGMTKGQMLDLADSMGLDPSKISEAQLARMFGGTTDLGAKILAARRLVVQSAGVVSDAMKAAATGTDQDLAALGVAIARHDMIQSTLAGVTAEWGRAGNAFHSLLQGWQGAQDINQLLKDNLGRDLFQLKQIAKMGARMDTPGKVSKFLRDAGQRSFGRMILEYWVNGLISGVATHVTYSVGNTILAVEKAGPETAAAWAVGKLRAAAGRAGERVQLGEVGAQFRGAFRELPAAAQASLEAYRSGVTTLLPGEDARPLMPFQGDTDLTLAKGMTNAPVTWAEVKGDAYAAIQGIRDGFVAAGELVRAGGVEGAPLWGANYSPLGQIPNLAFKGVTVLPVGDIARFPSRNIAAIHSAFRAMNYSMEINALAYRQAATEGLTRADLAARTADLRQNPTEEMMEGARTKATDQTLMGQGGAFIEKLSALFNWAPKIPGLGETPVLKFIDPFVHIAANVMDQSLVKRTPLGLLSGEVRADLAGVNGNIAQDTAAAKMLVGTAIGTLFGGLAAQGLVSGSGPSDPNKAAMWRLAGNQAHSVRVGDIWYDVHRLGPMGMVMSVAADMYDVAHEIGTEDADVVGKSLMHAISQNILDESFMRGPADLIQAVTDPGRYGAGYVRNFLSSFIPYSVGMAQMARASDPYSRQARTIMDTIRAKIPGQSEQLFPRRDIWGQPMSNGGALIAPGATAIYERQMSNDPVNLAMLAIGVAPAPVERSIRNVQLSDQQYDDFSRIAGVTAKMRLDALVRSPDWQTWTSSTQHDVIQEVLRQTREAARGVMMMKYPDIPREAAQKQVARRGGGATPIH